MAALKKKKQTEKVTVKVPIYPKPTITTIIIFLGCLPEILCS